MITQRVSGPQRSQVHEGPRSTEVLGPLRSHVHRCCRSKLNVWVRKRDVGRASQVLMLSIFLRAGDGVSAGHCLCLFSLSLSLLLFLPLLHRMPHSTCNPSTSILALVSLSASDILSHLLSHCPQFSLRVFVYIHALCLTPILHHRISITSTNSAATLHSDSLAIDHFLGPRF